MSLSREPKYSRRPPQSVSKSSDTTPDLSAPTQSVAAVSELVGGIATLSLQPCKACESKGGAVAKEAKWFCRECKYLLSDECKLFHKKFKTKNSHNVISLASEPKDDAKRGVLSQNKMSTSKNVPVADKEVQHVGTFNVQSPDDTAIPVITSSSFLCDSSLLLVDASNKKLKHFNSNFQLWHVKQFKVFPRCLAVNENDEVVITTSKYSIIKLSVRDTIERKGIIKVNFDCGGIDFINRERLAVIGNENPGIFCVYTLDGTEVSRTTTDKMGVNLFLEPFYVTVHREGHRAYVSDLGNNTVVALDLRRQNNVLFRYTTSDFSPSGIGLSDGCINICNGHSPGSPHQISEEGVYIKLLLSEDQCMKYPRTISFAPSGDIFIVGGGEPGPKDVGKNIHVYNWR